MIPRLIGAELVVLPPRLAPESESREASTLKEERARFAKGEELATLLDERAARFLDPALDPAARGAGIASADAKVHESSRALEPAAAKGGSPEASAPPRPVSARLWDGNGRGELLEAVDSPASAAKAKSLDLFVYGDVSMVSGYALVRVEGYDASLQRTAFSWKAFCSPDDPAPLAKDFAARIERWVAGRDFARLDLDVQPRSARVYVDGESLSSEGRSIYRFEPGPVRVEAEAPGYDASSTVAELVLGERRSLSVSLAPAVVGSATITVDAPDATVLVDSVPAGGSPVTLPLSGRREIVTAYAPGRERATVVLPASGQAAVSIDLSLDEDGAGRLSEAKDDFFKALGWFFVSLPVSSLAVGIDSINEEAAARTYDSGLISASSVSDAAKNISIAGSAVLAINAIVRLYRYLRLVR